MIKENNYIQLPPLRRDTDLKVVMALWEYVKMPEESRQKVLAFLDESDLIICNHFLLKISMILIKLWERLLMTLL